MSSWILSHGDCDGVCSASIALAAFPDSKIFFTHPYGLSQDLKMVSSHDHIIICDVALCYPKLQEVLDELKRITKGGGIVIYIDHHPFPVNFNIQSLPGNVIHTTSACASELTYNALVGKLNLDLSRISIYGAIGDYCDGTAEVKKLLSNWDKRTLYFETGILVQGLTATRKDYAFKRRIVLELAENILPSRNEELVRYAVKQTLEEEEMRLRIKEIIKVAGNIAYVVDPKGPLSKAAIYVMATGGTPVGVAGEVRGDMIDISLRSRSIAVNLNELLLKITPKLNGTGGGHPSAAGARLPYRNFPEFIKEITKAI